MEKLFSLEMSGVESLEAVSARGIENHDLPHNNSNGSCPHLLPHRRIRLIASLSQTGRSKLVMTSSTNTSREQLVNVLATSARRLKSTPDVSFGSGETAAVARRRLEIAAKEVDDATKAFKLAVEQYQSNMNYSTSRDQFSLGTDLVTLIAMPDSILVHIMGYNIANTRQDLSPMIALERTSKVFNRLLTDERNLYKLFGEDFFDTAHYSRTVTLRDKIFLPVAVRGIALWQSSTENILLRYLGGADGFRRVVDAVLERMNSQPHQRMYEVDDVFLRGDTINYIAEVIQSHIIAMLVKVNAFSFTRTQREDNGSPPFPCVEPRDYALTSAIRFSDNEMAMQCCQIWCQETGLVGLHRCNLSSFSEWEWPDDACQEEQILSAEARRQMVRALSYRAGVTKLSSATFDVIATDTLHSIALLVIYGLEACVAECYRMDSTYSENQIIGAVEGADGNDDGDKACDWTDKLFNQCPPPKARADGTRNYTIVPRQIEEGALKYGMQRVVGSGWAVSDGKTESEEVEEAKASYLCRDYKENSSLSDGSYHSDSSLSDGSYHSDSPISDDSYYSESSLSSGEGEDNADDAMSL